MRRSVLSFMLLCGSVLVGASLEAQTLSLDDCRTMASSESVKIRNAELDVKAAEQQKKEVLWEYFPGVSLVGGAFHALNPLVNVRPSDVVLTDNASAHQYILDFESFLEGKGINPAFRALNYGVVANVTLMQPVYAGGRIVNGNRLASVGVEAARLKQNISAREVSQEVSEAFYQVVLLEEKSKTLSRAMALVDSLYKDVASAEAAGLATSRDLKEVSSRHVALRGDEVRLRNGLILSKMALCNLIGQPFVLNPSLVQSDSLGVYVPYIGDLCFVDSQLDAAHGFGDVMQYYRDEEMLCDGMDEVALLGLAEKAARLQKKMVVGEALPQVAFGGSYGYNRLFNRNNFNGMLFATVKIPLTDWGKTAHKARRYEYESQKAENNREYLSGQLLLQVRKFWMDVVSAREQVDVAGEALDVASATFAAQRSEYEAGQITVSELLMAEIAYRQEEEAFIERSVDYLLALEKYLNLVK